MSVQPHPSDALVETVREAIISLSAQCADAAYVNPVDAADPAVLAALSLLAERLKAAEQEKLHYWDATFGVICEFAGMDMEGWDARKDKPGAAVTSVRELRADYEDCPAPEDLIRAVEERDAARAALRNLIEVGDRAARKLHVEFQREYDGAPSDSWAEGERLVDALNAARAVLEGGTEPKEGT